MSTANKALVEQWFEPFNTGEVELFDAIHDARCRNHAPAPFDVSPWPPEGREFGPGAIAETVRWLRTNQPDLHVTIESLLAEGDQVVAWVYATGTPSEAGPIAPTGRAVAFSQAHRFRIADGKIAEHWAVRDDLRSMIQAGVISAPSLGPAGGS